jgi:hypothetical protein
MVRAIRAPAGSGSAGGCPKVRATRPPRSASTWAVSASIDPSSATTLQARRQLPRYALRVQPELDPQILSITLCRDLARLACTHRHSAPHHDKCRSSRQVSKTGIAHRSRSVTFANSITAT